MYYQAGINTVFRRYNITVVVAFIVIILVAFSVASLRYFNQLTLHKQQSLAELKQEAQQVNNMLEQSVQAVVGIKEYAEYILKHKEELDISTPYLSQDGQTFHLNKTFHDVIKQGKRLSSNITGLGDINQFSELKKQEIAMAYELTPAFIAAQNIIEEATWFYYISFDNFVNIYPWVDREIWQFNENTLTNPHNKAMKKLTAKNNRVVWSAPYLDAAGGGMNASLGTGVFYHDKLLGSVVIDINLTRLHDSLTELKSVEQGLILYNENNEILLSKRLGKQSLSYRASWQDLLPKSLQGLSAGFLVKVANGERFGDWLIEKQEIPVNGWTLLKYQKYENFSAPQYSDFIFVFSMLFIGLLAFLMLINSMTKRTFIKPTTEFIRHIEFCAEGDPGKVTPAADWLHWFQIVEDIFAQNRSLLLQLTEQNDVLDSRVNEKTQALLDTSAQHQRDYALLRSVMNAIPELIVFNDPQGMLMGCNQAFERLTKRSVKEMLGFKSSTFMPELLAAEVNRLNSVSNDIYPQQALIIAGDYIYQGFCNQFTDDKGNILGSISIFHDVTVAQNTQSALEKAKDQAEYANKVKIQFLANMSHEVRTPINAIQGMMDILARTPLDTRQQHYLVNAQSASSTLLHLIDELLDLSKIEAGKMVVRQDPVNLPIVIDKALKLNITSVNHSKVEVFVDLNPNVPSNVLSDEMRLVQVLANLLNNAIKFTERGTIRLTVNVESTTDNITQLCFKVIDTGIGIASNKQSHLFNAFSQADESMTRKYGGSGLGLSICKQIIELMGGKISLISELDQGSELSFTIPMRAIPSEFNEQHLSPSSVDSSESLPKELTKPLITGVSVYAMKMKLEKSFINSMHKMGWIFYELNDPEELIAHEVAETSVLLIDETILSQLQSSQDFIDSLNTYSLICLCQLAQAQLSNATCAKLESLSIPYFLLDIPLFRYALDQISTALFNDRQEVNQLAKIIQENKMRSAQSLKFTTNNKKAKVKKTGSCHDLKGISVLLVEDNLVNQLVAKELLNNMNSEVTIASNGQQATELLAVNIFDVVLMDIQMPVMDGLSAAKIIRQTEKYKHLPIIAMTAHAREEDKQQSLAAGMNLHMSKPVTEKVLFKSIMQVLNKP